jgi:hypothetical protein
MTLPARCRLAGLHPWSMLPQVSGDVSSAGLHRHHGNVLSIFAQFHIGRQSAALHGRGRGR